MIPQRLLNEYMQIISYVSALSERDLRRVWNAIDKANMTASYDELLATVRDIVAAYGDISATAAAEFYEAVAAASGRSGVKAAAATLPTDKQVEIMMRNALGPLWEEKPRVAAAFSKLDRKSVV
jgi:secreted Zn-dependent insulinase-like peptidase